MPELIETENEPSKVYHHIPIRPFTQEELDRITLQIEQRISEGDKSIPLAVMGAEGNRFFSPLLSAYHKQESTSLHLVYGFTKLLAAMETKQAQRLLIRFFGQELFDEFGFINLISFRNGTQS